MMSVLLACGAFVPSAASDAPADTPVQEEIVVNMSLFSYLAHPIDSGHAWLCFENLGDEAIMVGAYELAPGESVSVGSFKYSRADGGGVYYNIECYCVEKYGANNRISFTEGLTAAEMEHVTSVINRSNYFTILTNCSFFAAKVWNSGSDRFVLPFFLPVVSYLTLLIGGAEFNRDIPGAPPEKVYKHIGSGDSSSLEQVSSYSLIAAL